MRATPSLLRLTKAVGGDASAAAAMSAAIFGPADAASSDQPAVSRTLTKSTGALRPAAAAAAATPRVPWRRPRGGRGGARRHGPKLVELGSAQPIGRRRRAAATPAQRLGVERHRALAGTEQDIPVRASHGFEHTKRG